MTRILNYLIGEITFDRIMKRNYRIAIKRRKKVLYADFNSIDDVINWFTTTKIDDVSKHLKNQIRNIYTNQIRGNISTWRKEEQNELELIEELQNKYSKKV